MNPVRTRLLSQQLASPLFSTAAEVVDYMGAMQAQDYSMMRLAVKLRTRDARKAQLEEAFDSGELIRIHLLRMTWQLVPRRLAGPLVSLCRERNMRSLRGWTRSFGFDPDEAVLKRAFALLEGRLQGGHDVTLDSACRWLQEENLAANRQQARYLMDYAEVAGVVCNGHMTDRELTYALFREKALPGGGMGEGYDRDETLAALARAYFRSHSPATLEDFVWWTGLNISDCRRGIQIIGPELSTALIASTYRRGEKAEYYLHHACRTRGGKRQSIIFLPPYDEYLIGYKSRHLVLDPQHAHHAHDNKGIFRPVILTDGLVTGTWRKTPKGLEEHYF